MAYSMDFRRSVAQAQDECGSSIEVAGGMPSSALPPAPITLKRSSCAHITPLGMPVVPPV